MQSSTSRPLSGFPGWQDGYAPLTTLVVVATANHWVLDVLAGAAGGGRAHLGGGRLRQRGRLTDRLRSASGPEPLREELASLAQPEEPAMQLVHRQIESNRVYTVQRIGALTVAAVILVFGLLGFAGDLDFFSTDGEPILGMSSNGLLSTVSVVTVAVLVLAALRSPRTASTIMIVVGILFLVAGLAGLAVLRTEANVLAFGIENVIFSEVAGLVLLLLGAYGRVSGNLPPDSPYARPRPEDAPGPESFPSTPAEFAAERAMREAEIAVVNHVATDDQRRRVEAMARVHSRADRREVWMAFDRQRR